MNQFEFDEGMGKDLRPHVTIFDTTLRDGEQAPGFSMSPADKVRLAGQLERMGVDVIEAGFPIASAADFEGTAAVARAIRHSSVAALARATPDDVAAAWDAVRLAVRPRIHVVLATSDLHLSAKLRITRDECVARAVTAVRQARAVCAEVEFSAEDATRSDLDFLCDVAAAVVEAGATTVNLPDTVGFALPHDITRMFTTVSQRIGRDIVLSAHCHNDLGMAVANSLAAVQAGARQVECTVNGIGERAGNAALEEIVMAIEVRGDALGCRTRIVTEELFPTSRALSAIVSVPVQPNKAIVGDNAFAHEAGIHQDGMIKNPLTYEIMRPESVGAPATRLVLGRHSGLRGLDARCRDLGHRLRVEDLRKLYTRMLEATDYAKVIDDAELTLLVRDLDTAPAAASFEAVGIPMQTTNDETATRHPRW
ncbi:MAG: 2-isopropylmalate synthase [Acidobacteriota bacterium]